jgi:fatty-acyl-CoA synthase
MSDPPADPDRPGRWVGAHVARRAALSPDRTALIDTPTGRRFSYADLDARANRTVRLLRAHGLEAGDRVAVLSRNRPALVDLFLATGDSGAVLAPLSHRLAVPELAELLSTVDPSLVVAEDRFSADAAAALDRADTDCPTVELGDGHSWEETLPEDDSGVDTPTLSTADPLLLLHTGGSTGTPKETVVSHGAVVWNAHNTITAWGLRGDDVTPLTFPMFHTGGWNVITVPLFLVGGTVAIAREFDPGDVLESIDSEGASVLVAVPAVLRAMTDHDEWERTDLSSLRVVKSGGGPCRQSVMEAYWDRGVDLSQGYGLTECGPNNFAMPDDWPREKADSVGVPAPHVDARIVDEDGAELPPGEIGELELAGPHAASGYLDAPEETAETFGGGWVSTGDLARVDAEGYFYIEGRKKDMFVSGGENVYPAEVEDAIADHPAVSDVVVVPVEDDQWGQVGAAVAVTTDEVSIEDLRAFLEDRLARYKHPRSLTVVAELPRSGPEKIDRQAAAELVE